MSATSYYVVLVLLIALILLARAVHPGKDKQGDSFSGKLVSGAEPAQLSIATFNIQTGKSLAGKRDINNAAEALRGVDLAAVQEVYAAGWMNKLGWGKSQSQSLANVGGFSHLFAATRYRWGREQRGNTTLSKRPVTAWRIQMLPDKSRKSPRNMTITEVLWQGAPVILINTHLHTGRGRTEQLETVLTEFMRHPRVILAGDFNTKADQPPLAQILDDPSVTDAIDAAGLHAAGSDRIDWILTRGFQVVGGREMPEGLSDHPYYEVSLQ